MRTLEEEEDRVQVEQDELNEWNRLLEVKEACKTDLVVAIQFQREAKDDMTVHLADKLLEHPGILHSLFVHDGSSSQVCMSTFFDRFSSRKDVASSIKELRISRQFPLYSIRYMRPMPKSKDLEFPNLAYLKLYHSEGAFMPYGPILGTNLPSLTHLSLVFIEQLERSHPDLMPVLTAIYNTPTLQFLELESDARSRFDGYTPTLHPSMAVAPQLTELHLWGNMGLIRALFNYVKYPLLQTLRLGGPGKRLTSLPPAHEEGECYLQYWLKQPEKGFGGRDFLSLTRLVLANCGPTVLIYSMFYFQMTKLKNLCLRCISLADRGSSQSNSTTTWNLMKDAPVVNWENFENLTLQGVPYELFPALINHPRLSSVRVLDVIGGHSGMGESRSTTLPNSKNSIVEVGTGHVGGLDALVKVNIKAKWRIAEALLDAFPERVENLEVRVALQLLTSSQGANPTQYPTSRLAILSYYQSYIVLICQTMKHYQPHSSNVLRCRKTHSSKFGYAYIARIAVVVMHISMIAKHG